MIKPLLVSTLCSFYAVLTFAASSDDVSSLPPQVRHTIDEYKGAGEVKKVTTHTQNGVTVYQVEFKGKSNQKAVVIAQDGSVINDEDARPGQGAKGKGKAKGKYKNRGGDRENEGRDEDEQGESGGAPSKAVRPSPRTAETAHPPAPTSPSPAVSAPAAPAPNAPKPVRSTKEVTADFRQQLGAINAMDKHARAVQAGLKVVSEETGVPLATIEAQRKAYAVGAGGLLVANELARATHKPARVFLDQRVKGGEWPTMAAANKVDLDPLLPKLDRVQKAMTAAMPAK